MHKITRNKFDNLKTLAIYSVQKIGVVLPNVENIIIRDFGKIDEFIRFKFDRYLPKLKSIQFLFELTLEDAGCLEYLPNTIETLKIVNPVAPLCHLPRELRKIVIEKTTHELLTSSTFPLGCVVEFSKKGMELCSGLETFIA